MTAHLTLPWNWVECHHPETCQHAVHLSDTANILNATPRQWVEAMMDDSVFEYKTSMDIESLKLERRIVLRNSSGQYHNGFGPAVEWPDGTLEWYVNGQRHRTDGPAIVWTDGAEQWYFEDKLHRLNGPAMIDPFGGMQWWSLGKLHRNVGPAVIWEDGSLEWWREGFRQSTPEEPGKVTL